MKKKSLIKIIEENKLSLKDNPFGIDRSWPKSYVDLFYNNLCYKLYLKNKSPNILEINQFNKLNKKLWNLFFDNPIVNFIESESKIKKIQAEPIKYDLIIINSQNLIWGNKLISKLFPILKFEGIIVVENIGREYKKISQMFKEDFSSLNLNILDFRLNKFILNNCLLTIKRYKKRKGTIQKIKSLFFFKMFALNEIFITVILKFYKTTKNFLW